MRRKEAQIERPLTDNKKREKAQTESSTTRKVRNPSTQEAFEESKKAEYAAEETMKEAVEEAAYEEKVKKMEEVNLAMMLPNLE